MEVNYSVDLLRRDEEDRSHITRELLLIKQEYGITNRTVGELGCGMGKNLQLFQPDNRVFGVEGLKPAVEQARSRGLDVRLADLQSPLDIQSESVDWLLCLDVLEHLVNPFDLMIEMRRILRAGGRAILNVPNHFNLSGRLKLLLGSSLDVHRYFPTSHDWDNPHLRFFTHTGIRQMGEKAGFKIVEDRSSHFCSLPKQAIFQRLKLDGAARGIAKHRPSVFAEGFFLILQKD